MVELNVATILLVIIALKLISFLAAAPNTGNKPPATDGKWHEHILGCILGEKENVNRHDELEAIIAIRPKLCYFSLNDDGKTCNNICPSMGLCREKMLSPAIGNCICDVSSSSTQSLDKAWKIWIRNLHELPQVTDPCISSADNDADKKCNSTCPDSAAGKCQVYDVGTFKEQLKYSCFCGKRKKDIVDYKFQQLPLATALAAWKSPCGLENHHNSEHLRKSACEAACPANTEGMCRNSNGNVDIDNRKNDVCYCQKEDGLHIPLKEAKLAIKFLIRL